MVLALRKATTLCLGSFSGWKLPLKTFYRDLTVADPGEGSGGPPPLFLDQNEARRAEKFFLRRRPPLPPPYLKVWSRYCLKHNKTRRGWGASMVDLSLWARWGIQSEVSQSWSSYMYLTVEITLCTCGMYSSFIWWREIIKTAKKNPRSDTRYLNFPHWSRVCFAKKSNAATNIDVANN